MKNKFIIWIIIGFILIIGLGIFLNHFGLINFARLSTFPNSVSGGGHV